MAAAGQMAEFFATFGFKINKTDIQKVDKQLDFIEKRIKKVVEGDLNNLKVNISGFRFTEGFNSRLYKAMQKKMSILNNKKGLSPEIKVSKFDIDRNELLREMKDAVQYVENNLRVRLRADSNLDGIRGRAGAGGAGGRGGVSRFGTGMGVGAAAGSLGRGFIPGLGLAFGVSQMNQLNQQLIGQGLAATAVFGDETAGKEQMDWVRNLGNKIGFDYRSQANPYMKMAAAGTTAGMGTEQVQDIFRSMAEYGRVMGLNDEDMKGSMRAVEQMLNKGQVYAEELKMQLGEKFPAAIQLMAEAVAGGDTEKLFDMMEKGEVSSIEALPKFAKILSRQARVGGALEEAMKTSLAEQMRFNNTFNDMVMTFSDAGFEEGQAGIFRTMADFFTEMLPLIKGFGEAWTYVEAALRVPLGLLADAATGLEAFSKYSGMSKGSIIALSSALGLILFPLTRTVSLIYGVLGAVEDFTGFLSGRKSLLGELLGEDSETTRQNFLSMFETLGGLLKTIKERISDIVGLFSESDLPLVVALNEFIDAVEVTLEAVNKLLGGKSKEQRMAESETHPLIRQAMMNNPEVQKGYGAKAIGGLGNFINENDAMIIPRTLGIGDLFTNMSNFTPNMETDQQLRNERVEMFRGGPSSETKNEYNIQMNVEMKNGNDPEEAKEMFQGALRDVTEGKDNYSE